MLKEARKETVHIDISVTSRNVDRKIMHPIRTIRGPTAIVPTLLQICNC